MTTNITPIEAINFISKQLKNKLNNDADKLARIDAIIRATEEVKNE